MAEHNKTFNRLRYERHRRYQEEQKNNIFEDETHSEVRKLSLREETESYNLTEDEIVEENEVIHTAAAQVLGINPKAITYEQKLEELEFLKQKLFQKELD